MLKRCLLATCTLSCLAIGSLWVEAGHSFGEPRIVPDTSYYFDNFRFDRYPYATVSGVINGNTIVAQVEGETHQRLIRLAGIEALASGDQPFQAQAVDLLRDMILYQRVKLEGDKFQRGHEVDGPVEAYVWLEGDQINAVLVRNGLATVIPYSHNIKYDNYFLGLQERARDDRRGIWSL